MGTQLHAQGIGFEACFDALNLTEPARVADVHRAYVEAGAELIESNTFGANRYKLATHGLESRVAEVNSAGVDLARRVIEASFRQVFLAGAVGPLGVRLAPFGRVKPQQAREAFREQVAALIAAGVDVLILETFSDLYEVAEAIGAVRDVSTEVPLVASMTFTRDDRTLLGDAPAHVAQELDALNVDVIGVNCSGGPAQLLRVLQSMRASVPNAAYAVMPNAGWPERVGGRIMYPATPEYFAEYARALIQAGASIVGGCCGTTPAHIAAMRAALDSPAVGSAGIPEIVSTPVPEHGHLSVDRPTQLANKLAQREFVVSVEMDPPRAYRTHKLLAGATLLAEAGADVINVADTPLARMRMSAWAVCHLIQREVGLETVLHFPTRGRNLLRLQGDLLAGHALGVRNLFVVMGDPTAIGDYPEATDEYDLVPSGLIKLVKQRFNEGVDHAGESIGQPTTFLVGCALNLATPNPAREMDVLHRKIAGGADFAITQPAFEPQTVEDFVRRYEAKYGPLTLPLLVGVLPLHGERHAAFLHNEVPGINIPQHVQRRVREASDAPAEGVRIAVELATALRSVPNVRGIYLMPPFNRYEIAAEIIERLKAGQPMQA